MRLKSHSYRVVDTKNQSKAAERLAELLEVANANATPPPKFESDKFLWIFGNIVQEYFADRIYEHAKNQKDWRAAVRKGLEIARRWFGKNPQKSWPFHQSWLMDYIKWKWLGQREGKNPEDFRFGGKDEFIRRHPKTKSKCQWYLGCSVYKELEVDHKHPWKLHGPSTPEGFQWLCKKHNRDWKKILFFWGDNFIPFRGYREEDQPR